MMFMPSTTSMMASPGNVASHHPLIRYSLPSASDSDAAEAQVMVQT